MNCRIVKPSHLLSLVAVLTLAGTVAAQSQLPRIKEPQLVLLDGETVAIQSLSIAAGKLSGDGVPAELMLDDLRRIDLPTTPIAVNEKPAVMVNLRGGKLAAQGVTIADDKCQIAWSHGEALSVPIEAVRAIRFEPATALADFENAVAAPSADLDRLFLKLPEGKFESITGLVVSLSATEIAFEIDGANRTLPRDKLFGIVVAQPDATGAPPPASLVLRDGGQLGGEITSLNADQWTLQVSGGGKAMVPSAAVARVLIRSSRVAFLSDLKPTAEEQQAIVTLPRPAQRDRAVTGKPLTLGPRTFEKGLGVHARSSLTFAAEKKYDVLAATIGLDASAGGKGDCIFTVLADGQPVFTQRMKGSDQPRDIQVPIGGVDQVTLLVEPGAELDLADHADWCEVRFIRKR